MTPRVELKPISEPVEGELGLVAVVQVGGVKPFVPSIIAAIFTLLPKEEVV
jgi:hypothetical protein